MRVVCLLGIAMLALHPVGAARAQAYTESPGFTIRSWGTQHGLPQASVNTICQTPDGYIWLGTNGGLVRFDGVAFETFDFTNSPIPSIRITSLILDHAEGMWVATEEGYIVHFDGGFQTICQLPATPYQLVAQENGDLLALTRIGLYEIRGDSFRLISEPNQPIKTLRPIRGLAQDAEGHVWYSLDEVRCFDPDNPEKQFTVLDERAYVINANSVGDVAILTQDSVSLGHWEDGQPVITNLGASRDVAVLLTDEQLWLFGPERCRTARLTSLRQGEPDWHSLTLPPETYTRPYIDRESTIWIGTLTEGLFAIRPSGYTEWTLSENQPGQSVTGVGDLVVAGGNQNWNWARRSPDTGFERVEILPDETSDLLYTNRHGHIVISTQTGVVELTPELERIRRWDLGTQIFSYAEHDDGSVALGGKSRVFLRSASDPDFSPIASIPEHATNIVRCVEFVEQGVLFGSHDGLFLWKQADESVAAVTCDDGQPIRNVRSILTDSSGVQWIATYGSGLLRYKDGRLSRLSTDDGLHDNAIANLQEDASGRLWMNTNAGALAVSIDALNHAIDYDAMVIGITHIHSGECNHHGGWISEEGLLWFPTVHGLVSIDTNLVGFNHVPPGVKIKQLWVGGKPTPLEPNLTIDPGYDDIKASYVGLSYVTPGQVRYRRMLVGHDEGWIDVGQEQTVSYTNLPPGAYELRVQACNDSGVWSPTGASLQFTMLPHFYETRWFFVLVIAVLLAIIWLLYRARVASLASHNRELVSEIKRREAVEAEKQNVQEQLRRTQRLEAIGSLASGVAHDFNNVLFAIETSAIALGNERSKPADIQQATNVIRQSVTQARGIISSLKTFSQRHEIEHTEIDLGEVVKSLEPTLRSLVGDEYRLTIEINDEKPLKLIGSAAQLQQVVLNLVVNARDASPVGEEITVRIARASWYSSTVEIRVTDAGPGIPSDNADRIFDPFYTTKTHEQGTGLGLAIVHGIVLDHAGSVRVRSKPGQTDFIVELPTAE